MVLRVIAASGLAMGLCLAGVVAVANQSSRSTCAPTNSCCGWPSNGLRVTWLSRDPRNAMAALARTVPANHGLVEEKVLVLQPDLIVAGAYTTRSTVRS